MFDQNSSKWSRRAFLKAAATAPLFFSRELFGQDFWSLPRTLKVVRSIGNSHESVTATYWANGALDEAGYRKLCWIFRDVHSNSAVQMDPILFDILRGTQGWFLAHNIDRPIILLSGYRTKHTNALTEGAAKNSLHMAGRAGDFRIEGIPTSYLTQLGLYLHGGGVGFYERKGMVHVDSGRLRFWRG